MKKRKNKLYFKIEITYLSKTANIPNPDNINSKVSEEIDDCSRTRSQREEENEGSKDWGDQLVKKVDSSIGKKFS